MKEIQLTQGKVAMVDDEEYEWLSQWKWHAHKKPLDRTWYAMRNDYTCKPKKAIKMHRAILGITDQKIKIDHADGNGLNNQRSNIRICSQAENTRNKSANISMRSSRYKGVRKHRDGKWEARISIDKKSKYLGLFEEEGQAAIAYNEAAKKYHGEYAKLNVIK